MKTCRWIAPITMMLAVWPAGAALAKSAAETPAQISAGAIEITPQVSFSHSSMKREGYGNVENFTEFNFSPTLGYCLTDRFETTGGLMIRHHSDNGNGDTALGASAGLTYNFRPQGGMIPFASVGFGALFYDGFSFNDTAVLAPILTGGVRLLVGDAGSVNLNLSYQHESNAEGQYQVNANRMIAGIGVSLFPWQSR